VETIEHFDPSILKHGDMVLCRNNAPIVRLALKLISSGIPAKVLGRDISGVIRTMVKKAAKGNPNVPMKSILDAIENEIASKRAAASLKKDESRLQSLEDRWECLIAVSETLPTTATAKDLTDKLDNIFSDDKAPITLSTIHKAKGLEWDRVFILDFSLIGRRATSPEAKQQENNLAYVAITRAKRELRFITTTTERTV
jgi:superfamily I DNA/RNA helicase